MEVMESHIGEKIQFKKVCETEKATVIKTKGAVLDANEVQDAVFERFAAYVYLQNADPTKYGSLNTLLTTHKSLKNNQYPATVVAANDILSQYKFDTPNQHGSGSRRGGKQDKPNEDGEKDDVTKLAFAQMIGKCYCCGSPDHNNRKISMIFPLVSCCSCVNIPSSF